MKAPIRYIHIGYPKCASTALQKFLFSRHPELHHLGVNSGGTSTMCINDDVAIALEVSLRLEKDAAYDGEGVRKIFQKEFESARQAQKAAVGISSEGLSFTMHHDIDPTQKAHRLQEIFTSEAKIIIVVRKQWALVKSLYKEYLMGGLHLTYKEFVSAIYANQGRSFLLDLNYFYTYTLYCKLFGRENVLMIPFESLKSSPARFMSDIQQHMGVSILINQLEHANPTSDDLHLESLRRLNQTYRPNHARSCIEPVGAYRYRKYFEKKLGIPLPENSARDQRYIQEISQSRTLGGLPRADSPLCYDVDPLIELKISEMFEKWNEQLAGVLDIQLEEHSHQL